MLPTMIQMGICQSSCLEISNVICKGRRDTRGIDSVLGPGWRLGPGAQETAGPWRESCVRFLRESCRGEVGWHSACRGLGAPSPCTVDT